MIAWCSSPAAAQSFDIKTIDPESFRAIAVKITDAQRPAIDGRLTDEAWALAPSQGNFVQREPSYGAASTEKTEFRILYDDKTLYIGVWVWDSDPSEIMGSEMKRDAGLNKGDQLKITIDTFHDHRNAFYFSTNPLGAYKDANTVENGRTINYDWNAVWDNKTSIDERGWYVEMAIPLNQLRFKTTIGESTWGLNLCRILFRKNEESYWVPFPREWGASGFARVSNAGVLQGLNGIKSRRRIEFVPFLSPTASRDYVANSEFDTDAKYGGDFKIGVTDDLIADFTYHTDFAQVEADQEVVNLTRFSLFFPEKRQFFTESAGIFDFAKSVTGLGGDAAANDPGLLNIFYSRRIGLVDGQQVPIIGGGRVTGRIGSYALGVLNIATEEETLATRELGQRQLHRDSRQAQRPQELEHRHADRQQPGRHLRLQPDDRHRRWIRARTLRDDDDGAGEDVTAPATTGRNDVAGVFDFLWKSDRFNYGGQYLEVGERFNAEVGYVPRLDVRGTKLKAQWTPRPKWAGIRQLTFNGNLDYYENHAGLVDSRTQNVYGNMSRQDTSSLFIGATREFDNLTVPFATAGTTLPVGPYQWQYATIGYNSDRTKRVYGSVGTDLGGYYSGDRQTYRASVNLQVGKTLLFEPNYTHNRVSLPGRPLYSSNVLNFRVSHSFSPDFYLKGFVQYNDDRNTANFNFLWWYHYKPGSDFYVVYNQGWDTDLPLTSRELLDQSHRVRTRSLAVKMTYWLAR